MYSIKEDQIYWEDKLFGPVDTIYIDGNQKEMGEWLKKQQQLWPAPWPPFICKRLPVADYLFASAGGKIVGIESKTTQDFHASYYSRRLQRQSRELLQSCDVAMWGLMQMPGDVWDIPCLVDFYKWQACGGMAVILPWDCFRTAQLLVEFKAVVKEGRQLLSIISGVDLKRPGSKAPPCAMALQRMFTGVGPKLAAALDKYFEGNILKALEASDEEWRNAARVTDGILKQRRILIGE